jgi:transposase-like protein
MEQWAAIVSIAAKLGRTSETLRKWVHQAKIDGGARPGVSSVEGALRSVKKKPDLAPQSQIGHQVRKTSG